MLIGDVLRSCLQVRGNSDTGRDLPPSDGRGELFLFRVLTHDGIPFE